MVRTVLALLIMSFAVTLAGPTPATQPAAPSANVKEYIFKKTQEANLKVYVHFPPSWKASDEHPAIVFFFGGGWRSGSAGQFTRQATYLAERGMVAIRVDYRVENRHGVSPDKCVEDAKSAIRWVRKNAGMLGIDPSRIVASGGSAGGHLAACTAWTEGLDAANEDPSISSRPNALVLFNPVFDVVHPRIMERLKDNEALAKQISPYRHLKKDDIPTLILFGTKDRLFIQAPPYIERSQQLGNRVELYTAEGATHGFFNKSPWYERTLRRADEFLIQIGYLKGTPAIKATESQPPAMQPASSRSEATGTGRPNILFILADDLGWKDVGYHGSEVQTPILDGLAQSGVRLEQFYVQPVCSPTRAALMTGRYPIRTGLQVGVIRPWETHGLPLEERTLPQALKQAGYRTVMTGKWHLGCWGKAYLPHQRGFDHHYGHYLGMIDYFNHDRMGGLDWHRNGQAVREEGYTTNLIADETVRLIQEHDPAVPLFAYVAFNAPHTPLEAPDAYIKRSNNIADKKRRTFAAMVTCLDDGVGRITNALQKRGMLKNTLIVFSSDNGGPTKNGANNDPLRDGKGSVYEGGVRVPAFAVWPGHLKANAVVNEPLHIVDWYPTLLKRAGASLDQPLPIDGLDIWPTLTAGKPSPHTEILHQLDSQKAALRSGDWKLIALDQEAHSRARSVPNETIELFNIAEDPNEQKNVAGMFPDKVKELLARLDVYAKQAALPKSVLGSKPPEDFKAPAVWGASD